MEASKIAQKYQFNEKDFEEFVLQNSRIRKTEKSPTDIHYADVDYAVNCFLQSQGSSQALQVPQASKPTLPPEESVKRFSGESLGIPNLVYRINGARGRSIDIYPYKCVITTGVTLGSVLTRNATDGEKTIYYQDCIGLQVKYPGLTLGYVQFETAAPTQNNSSSNFFNENTFTYEESQIASAEMTIVIDYIKAQLDKLKEAQRNSWMSPMR